MLTSAHLTHSLVIFIFFLTAIFLKGNEKALNQLQSDKVFTLFTKPECIQKGTVHQKMKVQSLLNANTDLIQGEVSQSTKQPSYSPLHLVLVFMFSYNRYSSLCASVVFSSISYYYFPLHL